MRPDRPASIAGIPGTGEVFGGRYRVERVVGRGAMGIVVAALHTSLRQRVAVKFLLPSAQLLPGASVRFLREAQAAAAIRSGHIARVLDVGKLDSGIPYIVMEYLEGRDLEKILVKRGPLRLTDAIDYLLQACEALAEAHALGIVHRDLKPGNLFLTSDTDGTPLIKVLDFGLSTPGRDAMEGGRLTATEVMLGSPCYMSPEQVRSAGDVDCRADIWALGVILYQLLTARFPFEAPSMPALFVSIAADAPTLPRAHRPELPAELEAAILQCLEKDRARRVESITDLARLLVPFGSEQSLRSAERIAWIAMNPGVKMAPSVAPPSTEPSSQATTIPGPAPTGTLYQEACGDAAPGEEPATPHGWPMPEPHGAPALAATVHTRERAGRQGSSPSGAFASMVPDMRDLTETCATPVPFERITSNVAARLARLAPVRRTPATLLAGALALLVVGTLTVVFWPHSAPSVDASAAPSTRAPAGDARTTVASEPDEAAAPPSSYPPTPAAILNAKAQRVPMALSRPTQDAATPIRRAVPAPPPSAITSSTAETKPPLTQLREKR